VNQNSSFSFLFNLQNPNFSNYMKGRQAMVLLEKGVKGNEEMIGNIRKTGNPFGNGKIDKDKLYCC